MSAAGVKVASEFVESLAAVSAVVEIAAGWMQLDSSVD